MFITDSVSAFHRRPPALPAPERKDHQRASIRHSRIPLHCLILLLFFAAFGSAGADDVIRKEIPCRDIPRQRLMVAFVFGQSQAGNFVKTRMHAPKGVYSFSQGRCFDAVDPLPGANGVGGSVWTRLGALVLLSGTYDNVLFVPVSVGGTKISLWAPGGPYYQVVTETFDALRREGIDVTHLLWHQGEEDARLGTTQEAYAEEFASMVKSLRKRGISAPLYAAVSTRCYIRPPDNTIRAAQQSFPDTEAGIYAGPDTDSLGNEYRHDGCHFSDAGAQEVARMWLEAITRKAH